LGIWSALGEVCPDGAQLRCWNHRLTNLIDHLPNKQWSAAKELLRKTPYALSRAECEQLHAKFAPATVGKKDALLLRIDRGDPRLKQQFDPELAIEVRRAQWSPLLRRVYRQENPLTDSAGHTEGNRPR
jgi:hypothetical protein